MEDWYSLQGFMLSNLVLLGFLPAIPLLALYDFFLTRNESLALAINIVLLIVFYFSGVYANRRLLRWRERRKDTLK